MSEIDTNLENEAEVTEKTVYEAAFLLDPALSDEEAVAKQESFKSFLTERGAEIIAEGTPDSRKLAYTISVKRDTKRKDYAKAYFSWIKFDLDGSLVAELDKFLKADASVVRFFIVITVRENTLRAPLEGEEDFVSEDDEDVALEAPVADPKEEVAPALPEEEAEV